MNILEKEIEDLVFEALTENPSLLSERGLFHDDEFKHVRQPDLGNYGRPDIVGYSIFQKENGRRQINVTIFELKKDEINISTLLQASRYATGVEKYIQALNLKKTRVVISIILIGKTIDTKSDFVFLLDRMTKVTAYTYRLDLSEGLCFDAQEGFAMRNSEFKISKYSFSNLKDLSNCHHLANEESLEDFNNSPFNSPYAV